MKWYRYKWHKDANNIESCKWRGGSWLGRWDFDAQPEAETFLDFKTWLTFYNADVKNWWLIEEGEYSDAHFFLLPYYRDAEKHTCHFIKFINAREYRKFKRWYRKHRKNKNTYENLKEQTELATTIRKQATQSVEEALRKQQEALNEVQRCNVAKLPEREATRDSQGRLVWKVER